MIRVLGRVSSVNVRKVLWTLGEIGLSYQREDWGRGYASSSSPEFLALNPNGQIPVLIDDQGTLWESNAICRYLANRHHLQLLPVDPRKRALVEQWMDWQATDFNYSWRYAFHALSRKSPGYDDPAQIEASLKAWTDKIAILETQLKDVYLTGPDFTLADIVVGLGVNRWVKTPGTKGDFPAVRAYWQRLSDRPAARAHAGFDHA